MCDCGYGAQIYGSPSLSPMSSWYTFPHSSGKSEHEELSLFSSFQFSFLFLILYYKKIQMGSESLAVIQYVTV